jgi:flagellar biogenesis protein FliO
LPLSLVGVLAVLAGVLLPQLLNGEPALSQPAPSLAPADSLVYTPPTFPEAPDPRSMLLRLLLGTAFVLVLSVVTIFLSRRWLRQVGAPSAATGRLAVVETLPLGNRCALHLVRVGRQQVLVGVDAAGLKSLVALPELFDEALAEAEQPAPAPAALDRAA